MAETNELYNELFISFIRYKGKIATFAVALPVYLASKLGRDNDDVTHRVILGENCLVRP